MPQKNLPPALRVVRANRLTTELGHVDILDALLHAVKMREALQALVREYRSMPDGPLGRGLTNGAFLRAEEVLAGIETI